MTRLPLPRLAGVLLGSLVLLGSIPCRAQLAVSPDTLAVALAPGDSTARPVTITNTDSEAVAYCLSFDRPLQRSAGTERLAASAVGAACGEIGELLIRVDQEDAQIGWDLNGTAMTPEGHLFASDSFDSRTHELTQELEVLRSFEHPTEDEFDFSPQTSGLAYDSSGAGGAGSLWWLNREEVSQELFRVLLIEGYAWGDSAGTETGRRIEVPPLVDADSNEVKPQGLSFDPATARFYFSGFARAVDETSLWAVDTVGAIGGVAEVAEGYPVVQQAYPGPNVTVIGPDAYGGAGAAGEPEAVRIEIAVSLPKNGGGADRLIVIEPDGSDTGIETPLPDLSGTLFGGFTGEVTRSRVDPNGVVYYPFGNFETDGIVAVRPHPIPPSWLALSAWDGTLGPGESVEITLTFEAGTRDIGSTYSAALQVFEAETGDAIEVPLAFEVVPPVGAEETTLPETATLTAYPNPTARQATVAVAVPQQAALRVEVFDVLGRRVAVLTDAETPVGRHRLALPTAGLPSGLYLVRATLGGGAEALTTRLTVLH